MTPRIFRVGQAPEYLGVNINYFNAHIRPHLTEVKLGTHMICFDRLELDAYVDKLFDVERKKQAKKPLHRTETKKCPKELLDSSKEEKSGSSISTLTESEFTKARKRLIAQKQKNT